MSKVPGVSGILWDQEGANLVADIQEMYARFEPHLQEDEGCIMALGARAYDLWADRLGREPAIEDITPGVPGRWISIVRLDPV